MEHYAPLLKLLTQSKINMNKLITLFLLTSIVTLASAKPTKLTPYLADSTNNTGIAIVVCPGGSYSWLDMNIEGITTAQWLQANGINAFVLKYRVASVGAYITGFRVLGIGHKYPDMLTDVEWALKEVYEHADEYNLDTTKIGVMGFSAGGHLTMLSYLHNHTPYKPKFLCPIYPVVTMNDEEYVHKRSRRGALGVWRQYNKAMRDSLSMDDHVQEDCPPVFLVKCVDDPIVKYQNSELLDSALTNKAIPHKYIQYQTGGHGFGASEYKGTEESQQWKNEFLLWISNFNQ